LPRVPCRTAREARRCSASLGSRTAGCYAGKVALDFIKNKFLDYKILVLFLILGIVSVGTLKLKLITNLALSSLLEILLTSILLLLFCIVLVFLANKNILGLNYIK
jgi:hypothetical protein